MKKIFTLLTAVCIGGFAFGQTIFQSNLSSWNAGDPTDFMNTNRTNIASSNVVEQTVGVTYGTSMASLVNASTSHKRFVTDAFTVTSGQSYLIEMWLIAQNSGELRTNFYDVTNSNYGTYNPYMSVSDSSMGNLVRVAQVVTVPATCTSAEFILSLRNTDASTASLGIGIVLDSIAITSTTPPPANVKKIYDIQYTTAPSGDSPENGNIVTTKGVITGIVKYGSARHSFFIQDSAKAWNGIYIYNTNDSTLAIGDSVEVTGTVDEFFNTTQIGFVSNITVLNSGNTLPMPVANTTLSANNEEWEGVLINVTNAECTSNTVGNGMWEINDGSGGLKADDDIFFYHLTAVVGTYYDVTGIGHYSFNEYKILPRDFNDISTSTSVDELSNNTVSVYPNPTNGTLNFNMVKENSTINIIDITGKTLKTVKTNTTKVSMNLNTFANGLYFYNITDSEGNTVATNRFVIAK